MRDHRVSQFFDFMKVRKQIDWGGRMHVFASWGSRGLPESGLYSYITWKYSIPFLRFSECDDFDQVCQIALYELERKGTVEPCFDYLFIDESQDFGEHFFKLCEKITKRKVIVAGDIFQNIFDSGNSDGQVDFLLNKCYRTEPKTLMFAHAIGMGLYEERKVNWLTDEGWKNCGYEIVRLDGKIRLTRPPLRRFEDLETEDSVQFSLMENESPVSHTIKVIEKIREDYEGVEAEDIAVVILCKDYKKMVGLANALLNEIEEKFEWVCNRGFETKKKIPGQVYISNINHIKGLEFPFLICVCTDAITNDITLRNQIYTALTRSFLVSYFLISKVNEAFFDIYYKARQDINTKGYIEIVEPTEEECRSISTNLHEMQQTKSTAEEALNAFLKNHPDIARKQIESVANMMAYDKFESDAEFIGALEEICRNMRLL